MTTERDRSDLLEVPAPKEPGRYRIALVCLGNICRSPMAHVVVEDLVDQAGLTDVVHVLSSGTADYHVGKPMDRRAAATLEAEGYDPSRHRARQFEPPWVEELDLVLAMDRSNLHDLRDAVRRRGVDGWDPDRVRLFRSYDPESTPEDCEVPDPYYGGDEGFAEVLDIVRRTGRTLVDGVARWTV